MKFQTIVRLTKRAEQTVVTAGRRQNLGRSDRTSGSAGVVLLLLALLPWLASTATASGPAVLLQTFSAGPGMRPSALTASQGRLFFGAGDNLGGTALWKSDGTAAGTAPIKTLHDSQSWTISQLEGRHLLIQMTAERYLEVLPWLAKMVGRTVICCGRPRSRSVQ